MFKSKIKSLGGRVALVTAVAAVMAAAGASAASAEVVVEPNTGIAWEEAQVTVSGTTAPEGATKAAIVVCNMAAIPGTRCDTASATAEFVPIATYLSPGVPINVQRGPWANWNFTTGAPTPVGTNTTCYSEELETGSPCSVVVSFYKTGEKGQLEQLGAQSKVITFE